MNANCSNEVSEPLSRELSYNLASLKLLKKICFLLLSYAFYFPRHLQERNSRNIKLSVQPVKQINNSSTSKAAFIWSGGLGETTLNEEMC